MRHLIAAFVLASSAATAAGADYYSDSAKGWWWYQKEPEVKEKEPKKTNIRKLPSLQDYSYEGIWNMHPDDFEKFAESLKKKAVQNPSEENVKDYYEVQEIARKKALAFTNVAQYVWQKYPDLTTARDYPIATPGNLSRVSQIQEEKNRKLRDTKEEFALVYFYKTDCGYCQQQQPIIDWFTRSTGWQVKTINIEDNPGMGGRFGIDQTPAMILIQKGNKDFFPVSSGLITAEEIEDKTYRAVRLLKGEITPEEFSLYDFQRGGGFDVRKRPSDLDRIEGTSNDDERR
ncbi:conjugal transfer protein TraF [Geobacter sp. DSM 9736]|uniref:conjugal transfer protein TraF n=1 Tax=Geobacter sp. DSM 9736 TaxID=1277350 RepID=UPI000B50BE8B|nr:conjugal transfer protein TraF [Geobacter sp. DSM 9736]SNB45537.1 conjugal transfer pilus assembly protein TraF [Geobacter sp. DSM 9736]